LLGWKTSFHELAAPPQQTLAVLALHLPSVSIDRLLLALLALPVSLAPLLLFRNASANFGLIELLENRAAMILLVRDHLVDSSHVDLVFLDRDGFKEPTAFPSDWNLLAA
jgi:hypothetical protein